MSINPSPAALAQLRQSIRAIEGAGRAWGCVALGERLGLPEGGLRLGGLHECLPAAHFDAPAALGFCLGAAARTLAARAGELVWIGAVRGEFGAPYGPGLAGYGIDPRRLLLVQPRKAAQALWATEEAARSGPACVLAELGEEAADLVAARRLQLAAESGGAPLLLLRPPGAGACPAAHTRWRVAAGAGRPAAWSDGAPGEALFEVELVRARANLEGPRSWRWEWRHAARAFHLVAPLADRAALPAGPPRRAGGAGFAPGLDGAAPGRRAAGGA